MAYYPPEDLPPNLPDGESYPYIWDDRDENGSLIVPAHQWQGYVWVAQTDHQLGMREISCGVQILPWQYFRAGWKLTDAVSENPRCITLVLKLLTLVECNRTDAYGYAIPEEVYEVLHITGDCDVTRPFFHENAPPGTPFARGSKRVHEGGIIDPTTVPVPQDRDLNTPMPNKKKPCDTIKEEPVEIKKEGSTKLPQAFQIGTPGAERSCTSDGWYNLPNPNVGSIVTDPTDATVESYVLPGPPEPQQLPIGMLEAASRNTNSAPVTTQQPAASSSNEVNPNAINAELLKDPNALATFLDKEFGTANMSDAEFDKLPANVKSLIQIAREKELKAINKLKEKEESVVKKEKYVAPNNTLSWADVRRVKKECAETRRILIEKQEESRARDAEEDRVREAKKDRARRAADDEVQHQSQKWSDAEWADWYREREDRDRDWRNQQWDAWRSRNQVDVFAKKDDEISYRGVIENVPDDVSMISAQKAIENAAKPVVQRVVPQDNRTLDEVKRESQGIVPKRYPTLPRGPPLDKDLAGRLKDYDRASGNRNIQAGTRFNQQVARQTERGAETSGEHDQVDEIELEIARVNAEARVRIANIKKEEERRFAPADTIVGLHHRALQSGAEGGYKSAFPAIEDLKKNYTAEPRNLPYMPSEASSLTVEGVLEESRRANEKLLHTMASCVATMAGAQQQNVAAKVPAPKCDLEKYEKDPQQLNTMLGHYLTQVWTYIRDATNNAMLADRLQAICHERFIDIINLQHVNWAHESPFVKIEDDDFNKTPFRVVTSICAQITKMGDGRAAAEATKWINTFTNQTLGQTGLAFENPWCQLLAYVVMLRKRYDTVIQKQEDLESLIEAPNVDIKNVEEQLLDWNANVMALSLHNPSSAKTFARRGALAIHKKLIALFKGDHVRSYHIVKTSDQFGVTLRNCTHDQFIQYIDTIRLLVKPDEGNAPGAVSPAMETCRCMMHCFNLCTTDSTCPKGFSHARSAPLPKDADGHAKRIMDRKKIKTMPKWLRDRIDRESRTAKFSDVLDDDYDQRTFDPNAEFMDAIEDSDPMEVKQAEVDQEYVQGVQDGTIDPAEAPAACVAAAQDNQDKSVPIFSVAANMTDALQNESWELDVNGFMSAYVARTPLVKERKCSWWRGVGWCPHQAAYGNCEYDHPADECGTFVDVYCDPAKCRLRAACPKNHTKNPRKLLKGKAFAGLTEITIEELASEAQLNAEVDYDLILAHCPEELCHVNAMFSCAEFDGAMLNDGGANVTVLDHRDPRRLHTSARPINLSTSSGVMDAQFWGVGFIPFYDRRDEPTHKRSDIPAREKWTRVRVVVVNVKKQHTAANATPILPHNYGNHFCTLKPGSNQFERHEIDLLQPEVEPTLIKEFKNYNDRDVAMEWRRQLPYICSGEVFSFSTSKCPELLPLPWDPKWQPKKFNMTINNSIQKRVFNSVFGTGLSLQM